MTVSHVPSWKCPCRVKLHKNHATKTEKGTGGVSIPCPYESRSTHPPSSHPDFSAENKGKVGPLSSCMVCCLFQLSSLTAASWTFNSRMVHSWLLIRIPMKSWRGTSGDLAIDGRFSMLFIHPLMWWSFFFSLSTRSTTLWKKETWTF